MDMFKKNQIRAAAFFLAVFCLLPVTGCRPRWKTPHAAVSAQPTAMHAAPETASVPDPTPAPDPTAAPTPAPDSTPASTTAADPTPAPTPVSDPTPAPTPWPVDRHWWTFSPMGYGLSRGAGVFYNSLWSNYLVYPQGGVVIGKIKGYDTVKVYTKDPEERVIWVPYVETSPYHACYYLSGMELPEPVIGDNDLCVSDFNYAGGTVSDSAKAEALSYIERLNTEGNHRLNESKIVFFGYFSIAFKDCPGLGYLLPYRLVYTFDGEVYFAKYWEHGIVNCFALDPDSKLVKEHEDILVRSDDADEEFLFMQIMIHPSGEAVTEPHNLSASYGKRD